jgi:hypothetical protein
LISVHTRTNETRSVREIEGAEARTHEKSTHDSLSIFGANGLQPVSLNDVSALQVLDETRRRDFEQALAMLGGERGGDRRAVSIHFGSDKPEAREVRVSYGHEVPLWKTSYRLVLGEGAPFLQGWAIVENTGEEDWNDIRLSLIAGRPISFVQDLYSPLHATRPTVAPQILPSPLPQLYEQVLEPAPAPPAYGGAMAFDDVPAPAAAGARSAKMKREMVQSPPMNLAMSRTAEDHPDYMMAMEEMTPEEPAAQGAERGELFEYSIAHPVSIARRTSAMVPIVASDIEGEKLSIYNPRVFERPLRGFLFKNTSGVHLAGGPLTVFDDDLYAGDAQISDVTKNDERLISFAVDLDLSARTEENLGPDVQVAMKAVDGVLRIESKLRRRTKYTFRNSGSREHMVLIQAPIDGWDITAPQPEKTPGEVRFRVSVSPGATVNFEVLREKAGADVIDLSYADEAQLVTLSSNALASGALGKALKNLAGLKKNETAARRRQESLTSQLKSIGEEQGRIRANMESLDHKSELYNRYVAKLSAQEEKIESLQAQIEAAREQKEAAIEAVRKAVRAFSFS